MILLTGEYQHSDDNIWWKQSPGKASIHVW